MYINYFKLNEPPFSLTPDPRYLYMSARHREGLAHLLYGVQQPGGFIQLTGEIGCGKTTLCRCLVSQLPSETDIALILNPRLTAIELLAAFCDELRIPYPPGTGSIKVFIDTLNEYLLQAHANGRRTILVIDEAQNLPRDVLEQIRLLTNLETEQQKLLQIILIGQPELIKILEHPGLKQLAQRITARYHLLPLSRRETYTYIQHRLFIAGLDSPIFTQKALNEAYKFSGGVPRLINILCDRALLGAYAMDKKHINRSIIRKAAKEIRAKSANSRRRKIVFASFVAAILILLGTLAFTYGPLDIGRFSRRILGLASSYTQQNRTANSPRHPAESSLNSEAFKSENADMTALDPENDPETGSSTYAAVPESGAKENSSSGIQAVSRFADVVQSSSIPNSLYSSFNSLYSSWGIPVRIQPWDMGCSAAKDYGFQCLFMSGNWLKLRRLDVPAILKLKLPNGQEEHVALVGLNGNAATLIIGSKTYNFPVQEVDRLWDGSFIIIWKPPFEKLKIPFGLRSKEIVWIRQKLDAYEGKPADATVSDIFDENLRKRILNFQKTQFLIQDGCIGPETLLRLTIAMEASEVPMLSKYIIKGEKS